MSICGVCRESLYSVMNRPVSQIKAYSRDYKSANGERLYPEEKCTKNEHH